MTPPERLQDVTLAEVVAEMREVSPHDERFGDCIHAWADRIEAAAALSVRGEPVGWIGSNVVRLLTEGRSVLTTVTPHKAMPDDCPITPPSEC